MAKITKEDVMNALKNVYDMEIGFDVVSLGLIYDVNVDEENNVHVLMTLTTPMCPLAGMITEDAKNKVGSIEGVKSVKVELTFDPPWDPSKASDEVRTILGI
ncbi:aromatic ring hydroxylase [Marinitoga sp. 1135]|uniref:Putative metal-sulfur cluster biosynthetic enzyme n=1 Tax=Marinitoga piezophila (strain DSM 14283 / JCM 11233 / KA3) TaxID=443254 RepID=H2J6N2_MARPK|nr:MULTISPECIES: metal-sulfur cluster assembly factor [Marinitoga]AEX86313.1 putative metal-sulfur cluster biosynthetic enzyme [Marinitoga piezophila KA3]APT76716.1 aromatic ring hydroxylase [Marinitoga sp. 1137]NUU96495.1 aromatic ring hydroxylase [Marinitoga sp. 1135]NUU98414.1 aromatic ring hydroxylase [Marinitoga sp. 1138]